MKINALTSLAVISLMAITVSSCKHNKEGNFDLKVNAVYGTQSFTLGQSNTDPNSRRIQTDVLEFFLSHITLIKTDNSEIELKDVALIDFSDPNSLTLNASNISGDFKAIRFGVGVDSIQNNTDPNYAPNGSDLGEYNMYWPWLKYIFHKYEARCDTTGTGSGAFNWFPLYHIGGDNLYRTTTVYKDFSVCCDNKASVTLTLDVKKIFYGSTQNLDIITESTSQTSDHADVAQKFADNFAQAFSLN